MCMLQRKPLLHNIFTHLQNVIMLISFMIASCIFFSSFAVSFLLGFFPPVDDHQVRRVNKINSMLLGHVHECLVLWFFPLHFIFIRGLSTCYDLCTHFARVIILEAFCAITTCNLIINVEGQKNCWFAWELQIKVFIRGEYCLGFISSAWGLNDLFWACFAMNVGIEVINMTEMTKFLKTNLCQQVFGEQWDS